MKILAIRGSNLASLAGEFEVDLARGPLGAAGVFAIVGPTGAGKSTLLDAMCVALFDRTPRLTNHSRVLVGRGEDDPSALGAQDVRTILRRGAAAGYAEVDFESGDLRRYRARWSVRRARDRSDGNLQAQQITLSAIDSGERFGGTRTETLDAIHARLGLSFDQFRRSALLAQGEFAAFLRADGKDRSELLERMTGTEIYSRLSMAAHQRATAAETLLAVRRESALAIAVMSDGERISAEVVVEEAARAATDVRAALARAEAAARWRDEDARRAAAVAVAEREHAAARAVDVAAMRDELALRRRAEDMRGAWDAATRAAKATTAIAAEVATAAAAAEQAATAAAAVTGERAEIAARHAPIRAARIAAGLVERTGARAVSPSADADATWLAARAALAVEIAQWSELESKLAQRAAQQDAIAGIDRAMKSATESRTREARARDAAKLEHQQAIARHHDAKLEADRFAQRRGTTLDAARKAEEQARVHCAEVERLVAIAGSARQAAASRADLDRQIADLATGVKTDAKARKAADKTRVQSVAVRGERERVLGELRRAAGYDHARAELVDGEPCPLCGAAEHPWAGRGALDALVRGAEASLQEVVAKLDGIADALAAIAAREQARVREQARLDTCRITAVASGDAAQAAWRAQLVALAELILVDDPALPAAQQLAAEREATAKARFEAARAQRSQTEAVAKAAADAAAAVQLQQASVDELAARLAGFERKLGELDAGLERQRGERAGRAERHAELTAELGAASARWLAALPDRAAWAARFQGDGFASALTELATAWQRAADTVVAADAALAAELAALDKQLTAHTAAATAKSAQLAEATARHAMVTAEHDSAETALAAALDTAARAFLTEQAQRTSTATTHVGLQSAAAAHMELSNPTTHVGVQSAAAPRAEVSNPITHVGAQSAAPARTELSNPITHVGASDAARTELASPTTHVGVSSDRSEDALAAPRVESATDRALLAQTIDVIRSLLTEPSKLHSMNEQLAAVDRAIDLAAAVLAERQRLLADHAATRPPDDAADPVHLADALAAAEQRVATLRAQLVADADARARRSSALAGLADAERAAEADRVLGEVIGSHDGKLFRSFAQSLTLDSLLEVANSHLEELAPRYQLERVPRHDLELQVIDRDLASEVRSVQSLSGGESFLVSLALALGLSSMSAHDVRVRTLLIDEGFGTLDPATLDGALSVLDALQATGRQVGVISHIPQLVERVGAHVRVIQRGGGRSEIVTALS